MRKLALSVIIAAFFALSVAAQDDQIQKAPLSQPEIDKILKKVGEEAAETVIAAKNDDRASLVAETCDLLYHLLVPQVERNVTLDNLRDELSRRSLAGKPLELITD